MAFTRFDSVRDSIKKNQARLDLITVNRVREYYINSRKSYPIHTQISQMERFICEDIKVKKIGIRKTNDDMSRFG